MLTYVRDGDTITVHSMDKLARNVDDLRQIVKGLAAKQVKVKFIKEALEFTGEDSPISNLLFSVMGAFAEFDLWHSFFPLKTYNFVHYNLSEFIQSN